MGKIAEQMCEMNESARMVVSQEMVITPNTGKVRIRVVAAAIIAMATVLGCVVFSIGNTPVGMPSNTPVDKASTTFMATTTNFVCGTGGVGTAYPSTDGFDYCAENENCPCGKCCYCSCEVATPAPTLAPPQPTPAPPQDGTTCKAIDMPVNQCIDLASAGKDIVDGYLTSLDASDSNIVAVNDVAVPLLKLAITAASKMVDIDGLNDLNMCLGTFTGETIGEVRAFQI